MKTVYLKDYKPHPFTIESIDMVVSIFDGHTRVCSKLTIKKLDENTKTLSLNGEQLVLKSIKIDGQNLSEDAYSLTDTHLEIPDAPDSFILETEAEIYPELNTALEGFYRSGRTYCSQCEPEGFRRITWYIDRPDVMAKFKARLEADKRTNPILLSNGNCIETGDLEDGRHFATWEDPFLKPCYLFAMVAGDLAQVSDSFTTMSGRKVDLHMYVDHGNEDKCDHAIRSLQKSMKWDEDVYGREYDLDIFNIVAVNDFNYGAMENKSLNIFNASCALARPDTATDTNYLWIEGVVAHEYFHNWSGNRVTCRDWFQLSLKEGLTVFRDQSFSADMNSAPVKRIESVIALRNQQFPEDAGPMAHPIRPDNYIEINNFYTATVYEKGAEVIRMIANILGPETYRKATDLYFERHDGQAVTCDDFVQCMEDASDIDFTQFKRWYHQAGTPEVTAFGEYDESNKSYTLRLSQNTPPTAGQPDKVPLHIPVAFGLLGADGADLLPEGTVVLDLKEEEQSFTFENINSEPVPSILRGFSAPVILKTDLTDEDLRFLMVHDSDGFNRWEAGQTYAARTILGLVASGKTDTDTEFLDAFDRLISDTKADKALLAKAMALPSETYLAQQMSVIDVDGIHNIRSGLIAAIGQNSYTKLQALYAENKDNGPYKTDPASIAQRQLKNTALRYLMAANESDVIESAFQQYKSATNMTDCVAALTLLANTTAPERDKAFAGFYDRWKDDALVMDKWFAIQAGAENKNSLDSVKALTQHPDFTMENPNRVRALIGVFANGNTVNFHRADGAGYSFVADKIIELNTINPQVAARMLTPFRQWKRFDEDRKKLIKTQIERIANTPDLSPNVFEITTKALEQ